MQHIYVHVPFCARRCSYCDFSIAVRKHIPAERYADAITRELAFRRSRGEWDDAPVETVYLGGGTPSLLPTDQVGILIGLLSRDSQLASANQPEITLEANPDDVTEQSAAAWKRTGVNRVSLGVQSFDPAVLKWMHRTHDADAGPRAVDILRAAGIERLSLDLIFGLPDELERDLPRDLDAALALEPGHLSVYGLSVEARTPLARWISRGTSKASSDDRYASEFLLVHETLTAAGFDHYEVSNYARPGQRSRHNSAYWLERPYAGLGPSAHSFSGKERRWNLAAWTAYERALRANEDPTAEREVITPAERLIERLYLGLRTAEGVEAVQRPHSTEGMLRGWTSSGWVVADSQRLRLTAEGWLRLDEIVAVLTTSADSG